MRRPSTAGARRAPSRSTPRPASRRRCPEADDATSSRDRHGRRYGDPPGVRRPSHPHHPKAPTPRSPTQLLGIGGGAVHGGAVTLFCLVGARNAWLFVPCDDVLDPPLEV